MKYQSLLKVSKVNIEYFLKLKSRVKRKVVISVFFVSTLFCVNSVEAARTYQTGALIYQGVATAYGDAEAIAEILDNHQVSYQIVSSEELDAMTLEEVSSFGMIVWPGGYAGQMSNSLSRDTREMLRQAVNEQGVSFVGFCAGAFIAVSPDTSWGLSIIRAETLPYYYLLDKGVEFAMVPTTLPGGKKRDLVWWGGPYLPDYPKGVIARFEDTQQASITQSWAGKGFVILSAGHPEAPQEWRDKLELQDRDGLDQDLAWDLFKGALNQQPLQTLN